MTTCDIGMIGLRVMGRNLVLNMNDHGYRVAVYNRSISVVDAFLDNEAKGKTVEGAYSIEDLVSKLKRPRLVMMMIKAGKPVDLIIDALLLYLDKGDIIIDGGNSNYHDTIRRMKYVTSKGLYYIGVGISGGEEGARHGASIMPGGSPEAWSYVKDIFYSIAAKVEGEVSCCDWVGEGGAGHFVKMVHNGIEYGDMQLIAEAYHLMKCVLGMNTDEMHNVFAEWSMGKLNSYLIEITSDILVHKDKDGNVLLEKILDTAGQKGTGSWTGITALEMGIPLNLIIEAVLARSLSALKEERVVASRLLSGPEAVFKGDGEAFLIDLQQALYASKIISYAQGYMLMRAAAAKYGWELNYGKIARTWREGCIIRSAFLDNIKEAYERDPNLQNILFDDYFKKAITVAQAGWRRSIARAVEVGVPVPAMSSALAYYDGYRHAYLPANLIQAQRDYFGAHTYERVDKPRDQFFHTDWTR